jgi:hypothetical protein
MKMMFKSFFLNKNKKEWRKVAGRQSFSIDWRVDRRSSTDRRRDIVGGPALTDGHHHLNLFYFKFY